jgi:hypothetical protein
LSWRKTRCLPSIWNQQSLFASIFYSDSRIGHAMKWTFVSVYLLSIVYVHFRGKARLPLGR